MFGLFGGVLMLVVRRLQSFFFGFTTGVGQGFMNDGYFSEGTIEGFCLFGTYVRFDWIC